MNRSADTRLPCIEGIKKIPSDEIAARVDQFPDEYEEEEINAVRELHRLDLNKIIEPASHSFAALSGGPKGCLSVQQVANYYRSDVTVAMAGAETGLGVDRFRSNLRESSLPLKRLLGALDRDDGRIHREAFESAFSLLVNEWKLGIVFHPETVVSSATIPLSPTTKHVSNLEQTKSSVVKFHGWILFGAICALIFLVFLAVRNVPGPRGR